ncbi:MAG TPA: HTTM domain-containing protein [Gemmatimonadales bacterium]
MNAQRWIERWNAFWFPPASPLNLAGARVVAAATQLFWFMPSLAHQVNLASKNSEFIDPQPIIRVIAAVIPREALFNPTGVTVIWWGTAAAAVLALVGLFTRTSLFLLALGYWILIGHAYSYADVHHPQALWAIFLMLLPFSPAGERLSIDALLRRRRGAGAGGSEPAAGRSELVMWPLKLTHVLLAATYFSTGITKLISGGLAWMNGYTLQNHLLSDAIARDIPIGVWLAQQYELCVLLSVGTILFEVFYFVSLFVPRTAPLFFLGGILFHVGLYVTAGHPFFPHIMLNAILLLFLDPAWFPNRIRRLEEALGRRPAGAEAPQPS